MLITLPDYEALSRRVAEDLLLQVQGRPNPLVCVASGDTPAGTYGRLVSKIGSEGSCLRRCRFVGLDEWGGMNGEDEGSCRWHLDRQFFRPAGIAESEILFFDGRAQDGEGECARIAAGIGGGDGLEVALLGLGGNGHVGMNEPGTPAEARCRVVRIAEETARTGQKYFSRPVSLEQGLSLGIADLLEARHLFLVVSGAHKRDILRQVLDTEPTPDIPATLLKGHPGLRIYADAAAAGA